MDGSATTGNTMKKIHAVIVTLVAVAFVLFAPAAKGQAPATAVVPSKVPNDLHILNLTTVLDWVVTNRQWNLHGNPLSVPVAWRIYYWKTDGSENYIWQTKSEPLTSSFEDFKILTSKIGMDRIKNLAGLPNLDASKPLRMTVSYGYVDLSNPSGGGSGFYARKDLGLISDITADSFLGDYAFEYALVTIRIPELSNCDVYMDTDTKPFFSWNSTEQAKDSVGQIIQIKPGILVLDGLHFTENKARLRIDLRVGTEKARYNQDGIRLGNTSLRMLGPSQMEATLALGFDNTVEYSTNLVDWLPLKKFDYVETETQRVFAYPPYETQSQMFFRLKVD